MPALRRGRSRLPALVLLAGLAAACGGAGDVAVDPSDGVPPPVALSPVGTAAPRDTSTVFPLTGTKAPDADAAERPAVAVALRSGGTASPVRGVDAADLVYVAFPGSGRQRSVAVYQSRDADRVGPVASVRPLDAALLRVLGPVLVHAGGTTGFLKQVDAASLPQWSTLSQPSSFERDDTGAAYGSTKDARGAKGARDARPGVLPFAPEPLTGDAPDDVTVRVPGQDPFALSYDDGTWSGTVGGLRLSATNVLVQEVAYSDLLLPHTGGLTERTPDLEDEGRATVLAGPQVAPGSWNRPGRAASLKYVLKGGTPARLSPGTTWVLLVPEDTEVDT